MKVLYSLTADQSGVRSFPQKWFARTACLWALALMLGLATAASSGCSSNQVEFPEEPNQMPAEADELEDEETDG